jgi:hypothetical protein
LSTTNPIWPNQGSNLGSRGGKPATNRLSYGAAPYTYQHIYTEIREDLKSVIIISYYLSFLSLQTSVLKVGP